jgi:hypothetical protein
VRAKLAVLLLAGLPACVVDTPIADRPRSAEQALIEETEDWCFDICSRLVVECSKEPCGCDFDDPAGGTNPPPADENCACAPDSVTDCALNCEEVMLGFRGHGEECAEAGVESMRCLDNVDTCDELESENLDCFVEPKHVPACNGGAITCEDEWGGTGGTSNISPPSPADNTGGAASGTAGTASVAGSASVGGGPAMGIPGAAGSAAASQPYTSCQFGAGLCSDGADYLVTCAGSGEIYCTCFRNALAVTEFALPSSDCYMAYYIINPACGWNISNFE